MARNLTSTERSLCDEVRQAANGVLPVETYEALYEIAAGASGSFVEIGTAHGAATIVLARSAQTRVYTVDPFHGRRHRNYGGVGENVGFTLAQFARFGVAEQITLVVGTSDDLVAQHDVGDVGLLLIDADGRIDRDLAALSGRLAPGCQVIIDDIDDNVYFEPQRQWVDQKHRIARLLSDAFVAAGFLTSVGDLPKRTRSRIGRFTKAADWTRAALLDVALPCYRSLVNCQVSQLKRDAL